MSEPTERDLVGGPAVGQSTEGIASVARTIAARKRSGDKPGEEPEAPTDDAGTEASPEVLEAIAEETTT